jgi:hypothetical protein
MTSTAVLGLSSSTADILRDLESEFVELRRVQSAIVRITAELAECSRRELGRAGMSALNADTSPAATLARIGRITISEARRFVSVARATASTLSISGEPIGPRYPHLAAAIAHGAIPLDAAAFIVSNLDQVSDTARFNRAHPEDVLMVEGEIVAYARECQADWVRQLAIASRDHLDIDGIEPREAELVKRRSFTSRLLRNGMQRNTWDTDPLTAAGLNSYIDGYIGNVFHSGLRNRSDPFEEFLTADPEPDLERELVDPRSRAQLASDAVLAMIAHVSTCGRTVSPMPKACIVVRMTLESLLSGLGEARLDGIEQPISAATARRLAVEADIIPIVLGGDSRVLDLGRARRLFSKEQKLAVIELFPTCAACDRPPDWTEVHHMKWFDRDWGLTDLANAIPLCTSHHHSVHDNGWEVVVKNGVPWFIPPTEVDIYRTPRRGRSRPQIDLPER